MVTLNFSPSSLCLIFSEKELQEGYRQMQQDFATKILHSSSSSTSSSSAPHHEKRVNDSENKDTGASEDFYFTLFDPNMVTIKCFPFTICQSVSWSMMLLNVLVTACRTYYSSGTAEIFPSTHGGAKVHQMVVIPIPILLLLPDSDSYFCFLLFLGPNHRGSK